MGQHIPQMPASMAPAPTVTAQAGYQPVAATQSQSLPSEQLPAGWLPQVLQTTDLTVLCLFSVLLITNVPVIAAAGGASFVYWILGFLMFLVPSALVCAQLYRLFPGEAAVYLWANKALGSFWDTFLGFFCNWWPGALGLTVEAGAFATSLQALNGSILDTPWKEGAAEIAVLLLAQGLCLVPLRYLRRLFNAIFGAYMVMFTLVGVAGLIWVSNGHHFQGDISAQGWQIGPANYPVFAIVIVSLLGMAVPLNAGLEIVHRRHVNRYLLWGTIITIVGYLFATFGVLAIVPPQDLANPAFISELFSSALGSPGVVLGNLTYIIMVLYFICATAAFNLMFARLLVVGGVDRRLPFALQRRTAQGVPLNATMVQTGLNIVFVAILFFVAPAIAASDAPLSLATFLVTINAAAVVWNIAMIGLFLCGILLCLRYEHVLKGRWIVPPPVFYTAAGLGVVSALIAIYFTFFAGSPLPDVLNNTDWVFWVLLVVLASLAVGALYSFLVPEVEDLVFLLQRTQRVRTASLGESSSAFTKETYEQANVSHAYPASIPEGVSAPGGQHLPGQLFSGPISQPGEREYRNLPR
ncbi:MAG: APC family permease [Ktedonobacteraceae bacterium]|nr:APC family permease [Ktedonobacteraceae bacterium]